MPEYGKHAMDYAHGLITGNRIGQPPLSPNTRAHKAAAAQTTPSSSSFVWSAAQSMFAKLKVSPSIAASFDPSASMLSSLLSLNTPVFVDPTTALQSVIPKDLSPADRATYITSQRVKLQKWIQLLDDAEQQQQRSIPASPQLDDSGFDQVERSEAVPTTPPHGGSASGWNWFGGSRGNVRSRAK